MQGVKIGLMYVHKEKIFPYEENEIVVPVFEVCVIVTQGSPLVKFWLIFALFCLKKNFRRYKDATGVTKEHLLMTLSNIDRILISASFLSKQYTASLVYLKNNNFFHLNIHFRP